MKFNVLGVPVSQSYKMSEVKYGNMRNRMIFIFFFNYLVEGSATLVSHIFLSWNQGAEMDVSSSRPGYLSRLPAHTHSHQLLM